MIYGTIVYGRGPIACPVPGKISELRVYGFIRFTRNPTCAFAYFERWYLDSSYILFNLARKKKFQIYSRTSISRF